LFITIVLCSWCLGQAGSTCSASPNEAFAKPTHLSRPNYPPAAKAVHATGDVVVFVTVDSEGKVSTTSAEGGHPLLRKVAEIAASEATFEPVKADCRRLAILTFTFLTGPPELDELAISNPFHVQIFAYERPARKQTGGKDPCKDQRFMTLDGNAPTLSIKDALEFPECIEGRLIRLYGVYSAGFEGSVYGAPSDNDSAWVEFSPYYPITKKCSAAEAISVLKSPGGGTFGLVAYGILKTGGGFGHMNGWDTEFQVMCVDEMKKFSDVTVLLEYQKPNIQKQILDWYTRKH